MSPRWLSDLKSRIGRCITFGLSAPQQQEAGRICEVLARDWRELVAGSEGFLTAKGFRGLWRQHVVWGEMVRPSSPFLLVCSVVDGDGGAAATQQLSERCCLCLSC